MKSLISPGQDGYHSPLRNEPTHHTVEPHHLQHYNGSWLFIAYSHERNSWRKFALPHQRPPAPGRNLPPAPPQRLAGPARRRLFGLIQGPTLVTVTLRFTPFRAGWIREQIWHEDQKMVDHPDGRLDLSFPAADLREVKLRVLQFGAEVEVIEPLELLEAVREEAARMVELYRGK